jgi:hypothetical protein
MEGRIMNEKKLAITLQKEMNCYLWYALKLCVIFTKEGYINWYHENFIQIQSYVTPEKIIKLDFEGYKNIPQYFQDVIYYYYFQYSNIIYQDSVLEFIKDKLGKNFYLELQMDEYFIPQKENYLKQHFMHPSLICGYDDKHCEIYAVTFDRNRNFSEIIINYDDLEKAFESGKKIIGEKNEYKKCDTCGTFILKNEIESFKFDLTSFLIKLRNYLFSIRGCYQNILIDNVTMGMERYGLDVYDIIIGSLNNEYMEYKTIDYRAFHFLYEHKRIFLKKIMFIKKLYKVEDKNFNKLIDDFKKDVVDISNIVRMLFLKNMSSLSNENSLDRIVNYIKSIRMAECMTLSEIHNKLINYSTMQEFLEEIKMNQIQ